MVIEGSGLKRNDRVILKFAFDVHSYAFRLVLKEFAKIDQFRKLVKTLDGVRALIFCEFRFFDARIVFSDPKYTILVGESKQFRKKCKNGSA